MSPAERIGAALYTAEEAQCPTDPRCPPWEDLPEIARRIFVKVAQALLDAGAIRAPADPEPRVLSQLPVTPTDVAGWLQHPIVPEAL